MGNLNEFFRDLGRNAYGLGENVASLGSAAIAEPVAGFAAMYDPTNGAQAIREGMTYQPRSEAGQMYRQGAARTLGAIAKPAMPIVDTWQRGVDIAGGYSPAAGAMLRTVPAAIGVAMGAKPALQAGRQVSNSLGAMQARMIANANAPSTLNTAGFRGQRGTFAGINALTADKEALAKAKEMIRQGADPADVWEDTGWGKGVDGKWRFEIDDSNASIKPSELLKNRNMNQGDLLEHDQLYAAYPNLKKIDVGVIDAGAGYDMSNGNIKLGYDSLSSGDLDWAKTTNLHELQHAIQQRERFALGGGNESAIDFVKEQIALNNKKIETLKRINPSDVRIQKYEQEIKRLTPNLYSTNDAYKRLAGEVEARMVENRGYMNQKKRLETYPFEKFGEGTYSIEPEQQLIRKTWKDKRN